MDWCSTDDCKHIWEVIKKDQFESEVELLRRLGAISVTGYSARRIIIYTLKCKLCTTEKLEKFTI